MGETQLSKHVTDAQFANHYAETERLISEGLRLLCEAERRLNDTLDRVLLCDRYGRLPFNEPKDVLTHVRRQVWRHLVERLGIRSMCSVKRWTELQKQIKEGEILEITPATVTQMVLQFRVDLPEMHKAAVKEVFDWLRPRREHYKTNSLEEVGPRVILEYMVTTEWRWGFQPHYDREQHLTALENVFTALDGKGFTTKAHYSKLSDAIKASKTGRGETEYFEFKAFKNGNLHLRFKRLDLLKRLNQIAGGKRLKKG